MPESGQTKSERRIAVVTAVTGAKDPLAPPTRRFGGVDFILFSDDPAAAVEGWDVRPIPEWSSDPDRAPRRHARAVKVLTSLLLPGYDAYVWHDGTHEVLADPHEMVRRFLDEPARNVATFTHRTRTCVYQEANAVLDVKLDSRNNIIRQIRDYRAAGFPSCHGLFETGVMLKKGGWATSTLELAWWEQICRYSSRDQLSLPFVSWRLGIEIAPIGPGDVIENELVRRVRRHERLDFQWSAWQDFKHRLRRRIASVRHGGRRAA
jgi:hypothetical protein